MTEPQERQDKQGQPFRIRPYARRDRRALETMYVDFLPKRAAQGLPPSDPPRIREWLDRVLPQGRHLVVEVGGKVLGHLMLIPMDPRTVELANFLHQSVRDRGIGTVLNRVAIELAREDGYGRVWLSVEPANRAAVRSYEKAGFKQLPGSLWAPEIEMSIELDDGGGR